jgi:hypothetical protein
MNIQEINPTHAAALEYRSRGWNPTPVKRGQKKAFLKDWPHRVLQEEEIRLHFGTHECNVGIVLGSSSGGLVDVDLDCPEAVAVAGRVLPLTGCVFGRASTGVCSHYLYRVCEPIRAQVFKDADGATLVELRGDGQQTVFPPSRHPSGEIIEWWSQEEPAQVTADALRRAVSRVAAAALLTRAWPSQGSRQGFALALSGGLRRAGWTQNDVYGFVLATADAANDEEVEKRLEAVEFTFCRDERTEAFTGWQTCAELVGETKLKRILLHLGISLSTAAGRARGSARSFHHSSSPTFTQDTQIPTDTHDRQTTKDEQGSSGHTVCPPCFVFSAPPGWTDSPTDQMRKIDEDLGAGRTPALPLAEHISGSVEWHQFWAALGQPDGESWHTDTWGFVRLLKGHPELAHIDSGVEIAHRIEPIIAAWPRPVDTCPWRHWFGVEDAAAEIATAWPQVRYAAGHGPLDAALNLARTSPLPLPPKLKLHNVYELFVGLCGWLQTIVGEADMYLPCRDVGKRVGVSHTTISQYRRLAVSQGLLIPRACGRGHQRLADEFRFVMEIFPVLVEASRKRAA